MRIEADLKLTPVYTSGKGEPMVFLSQCPGKNFVNAKGRAFSRSLSVDLQIIRSANVKVIVNLLNLYELRTIGVQLKEFRELCQKYNTDLIEFPIIEMGIPAIPVEEIDMVLIDRLEEIIKNGQAILIHCRGGVGRAGLIAALLLRRLGSYTSYDKCLEFLRSTRHKNCVESMKQRAYMKAYYNYYKEIAKLSK